VPVATTPCTGRWSTAIMPCGTPIAGRKVNICWPTPPALHARSPRPGLCLHGFPLTHPSVLFIPRPVALTVAVAARRKLASAFALVSAVQDERTLSSSEPTRNAWKQSVRSVACCWMCRVWRRAVLATATPAEGIGVRLVQPTHGTRCLAGVMVSPLCAPLEEPLSPIWMRPARILP
jgi:hypothetical protein